MCRQKAKTIPIIAFLILTLTGCGSQNTNPDLVSIKDAQNRFDEEAEEVRNRAFDNISFTEAYFSFPDVSKIYNLEYEELVTDISYSPDEAYAITCDLTDAFFPGRYDAEEKADVIRLVDAGAANFDETRDDPLSLIYAVDLSYYPTLEQYKEKNLSPTYNHSCLEIANQDCYLEVFNGVVRGYDQGDLPKRCDYDRSYNHFQILKAYPIVYRTTDLESDRTYHLESGDITIAEAVRSANECLSEMKLSNVRDMPFVPKVQSVNVLDMGNGCFVFCFKLAAEYKKMEFHTVEMDAEDGAVDFVIDQTNILDFHGEAVMYQADSITRYQLFPAFVHSDVRETDSYTAVLPLEKAAEITSDYLTDGMSFEALSVRAGYKSIIENPDLSGQQTDEEDAPQLVTIRPCWQFLLQPTTEPSNQLYYVYVDMITGEVYTTIQNMNSDVGYSGCENDEGN